MDERIYLLSAGNTVVVNIKREEDEEVIQWARDRFLYVPIHRPYFPYANPYKFWNNHDPSGEYRRESLEKYRKFQLEKINEDDLKFLVGKALGCYCYPKPCHGDILIDEMRGKGILG